MLKAACELCGDMIDVDALVNGVCVRCIEWEENNKIDLQAEEYEMSVALDRFGCYD